jgi:magnesium and cobalt exporter, CNNM family
MDERSFFYAYILLGILLFFSFYFSGSETAIFSLSRIERNLLKQTKSGRMRHILGFLLDHQEELLITILTGNMIVNVFASSIGEIIGGRLFGGESELLSILSITLLLLLFGELTPKRIAVNHSKEFTRLTALPLYYLHWIFSPLRHILNRISVWILSIFPRDMGMTVEKKHALVLSAAELGYNQEILRHSEYRLFKSYLAFKEKSATGVMTPRSELKTLSSDLSIGKVIDLVAADTEYVMNSSIILFKEDIDHLSGWVPIARLLQAKFAQQNLDEMISTLSRDFHIVPSQKDLPTLIQELREADTDIALLVDEYGGTAGVVWFRNIIQDVLRAFYGPYKERFDEDPRTSIIIPGSMSREEFEEYLGIDIDLPVETVAGLFLAVFDDIPVPGDEITYGDICLRIVTTEGNKILTLRLQMRPDS